MVLLPFAQVIARHPTRLQTAYNLSCGRVVVRMPHYQAAVSARPVDQPVAAEQLGDLQIGRRHRRRPSPGAPLPKVYTLRRFGKQS